MEPSSAMPSEQSVPPQRFFGRPVELPAVLYWLSMLLMVWGGRILIDPVHRISGEVGHIYITLAAFEVYVWLLLVAARWQTARNLNIDAARFGIFAIFLQGLQFMTVSEMHMASQVQGLVVAVAVVALAVAKLRLGTRWLRVPLPAPLAVSCLVWIAVMTVPGIVLRTFGIDYSTTPYTVNPSAQHVAAFACCWIVALLVGLHVPLVRWQMRRGMGPAQARWWAPWIVSAALLAMAVAQLYTIMWGLWVDWAQWYFSPIYIAFAVTAITLCAAAKRLRPLSWIALAVAIVFIAVTYREPSPERMPIDWAGQLGPYLMHPLYAVAGYFTILTTTAALTLGQYFLFIAAAVPAVVAIGYGLSGTIAPVFRWMRKIVDEVADYRHIKGIVVLLIAFALLGLGVLLQWSRERRRALQPSSTPNNPGGSEATTHGDGPGEEV